MPNTLTSPAGTGADRSSSLIGIGIVCAIIPSLIVMLRVGYRISTRTVSISDICITLAMILNLGHSIVVIIAAVYWGFGKHEADLSANIRNAPQGLLYFWLDQLLSKPTMMFTKLSLVFIYRRLFQTTSTALIRFCRGLNYFLTILIVGYYSAAFLIVIFECTPVDKSWHRHKPGTCINKYIFFYFTGAVNITTSLLVISMPLPVLVKLKHRKTEITQLLGLILLGLIDTAASVIRMFTLTSAAASAADFTWTITSSLLATRLENSIAVIAASLVVMRPCFTAIHRMIYPDSHTHRSISGNKYSGYMASPPNKSGGGGVWNKTTKVVEVELASRSISTEDILRSQDRF
ncbi:hypothetical protein F5882DRAFT_385132 [Hyaloscypha sp. PMI_1271]|nr:hypothetical protein F5882DRAFT_385132 [Hyaloscypha sp. PMI_1271]